MLKERPIVLILYSDLVMRGENRSLPNVTGLKSPTVRNFQRIQIPFFVADEAILHLHKLHWRRDEGLNVERTPHSSYFVFRLGNARRE